MSLDRPDDVLAGFNEMQQRHLRRRRCSYGVLCHTEEIDFPATIVDLSLEGMRLEGRFRRKPGSTLTLRLNGGPRAVKETVRTVVRWCRKKANSEQIQLGIQYDEVGTDLQRSWVKPLLMEAGFDAASIVERRHYMRVRSLLRAQLREDQTPVNGVVINLGVGGALFEGDRHVETGTTVELEMGPHGARGKFVCRGTVRRSAGRGSRSLLAIVFKPLDDAQTALLHNYLRALRRDDD